MAYAQWAEDTKTLRGVNLSDSPDFRAFCGDQIVAGDIGKCSYHGALEGIESLNSEYPLWVTVVSPERQVLVEFSYNPAVMIGEIIPSHVGNFQSLCGIIPGKPPDGSGQYAETGGVAFF